MNVMIDLIDYGGGNLGSITRCLERLEAPYRIVSEPQALSGKNPVLFPGVGAFGAAMHNLVQSGLDRRIRDIVRSDTPYLGICIGLQVLFESSEEAPGVRGLGLLAGKVIRFRPQANEHIKIPQIGWNWIEPRQLESAIQEAEIPTTQELTIPATNRQAPQHQAATAEYHWPGGYVYFVNSYHPAPNDASITLYTANYGGPFCAAVQQDNITAFQFHPEKSGAFGLQLMRMWLAQTIDLKTTEGALS